MSKPRKRRGNPDFRHFVSPPAPPSQAIEAKLIEWLTPGTFANLKSIQDKTRRLRDRTLTLGVMSAIVVSLVYRQVRYLVEIVRLLEQEGLLWVEPQKVSKQAVCDRLRTLPADLFVDLFNQVATRIRAQTTRAVSQSWQGVQEHFGAVWIADGSTMSRLQRHLAAQPELSSPPLAGKLMMVVEAFTHRPVAAWHDEDAQRSDISWSEELVALLPVGGLLIVDMGFFAFAWFDAMSAAEKFFVTRLKQKVRYEVKHCLARGTRYRDEIICLGLHSSPPCHHPVRLVSVLWGNTWHRYLTNVLDPQVLTAQQVCELYRRRWTIESAFLVTKRLLGLAYFWGGGSNGVKMQIYATWIFYAVLNDLCADVAVALSQPIDAIAVEMVFRSLYHYARAQQRDPQVELIPFLVQFHQSLGLVKAKRKRQRQKEAQALDIWAKSLT